MSHSFLISRFPVPNSIFLLIRNRLAHLSPKDRRFVLHVLVSNLLNLNKIRHRALEGWLDVAVELPSQWITEHFSTNFKVAAIDPTVVSFTNHSTLKHECRAFKASADLLDLLLGWTPKCMREASDEPIVNLFDGKPYAVQAPKEREDGIFSPKIIRDAVKVFGACPFNYDALTEHLAVQQERARSATTEEVRDHLERVFRNDNACAMRIRAGCKLVEPGLAQYIPEFRTSYTGRIIEVGGGTQSCSREMKVAMFEGVPNLENWDLKRAQAFILLQELEDAGLPRDWTEKYVWTPDVNEIRGEALGMSKDAYKTCLYATIMGATHTKYWNRKKNKIYDCLLRECQGDRGVAKALSLRVYSALAPLKKEVGAWHDHLMRDASCLRVDPSWKKARSLKNACRQHFKLEGERADKLARKAAAFILQGQEAAFIHRLTMLGKDNGFLPISNQHDGLVVIGTIPKSAVDQAAEEAGLRYATMEKKSFL